MQRSLHFEQRNSSANVVKSLVPERRRQPFMLRHKRDAEFVGRADIIAELDQQFTTQRRVVLAGIGGVG